MKTVAVVQARMGSSRLPGKVMMPLAGRPMIDHVLERTARIEGVDEVVVAVADGPEDVRLADHVRTTTSHPVVEGPEDDVLGRYVLAARRREADVVVRITGDCPLISPRVSGRVLRAFFDGSTDCDYASNTLVRTYPRGLDTEVLSRRALERVDAEATTASQREHVTLRIAQDPRGFRRRSVEARCVYPRYRWTVDTEADYRLVRRIFDALMPTSPYFEFEDVLELMVCRRDWVRINHQVPQQRPK